MTGRLNKILDILTAEGEISVQELAERFDVSTMTVRRDLATLERDGILTRTHGGAVLSRAGVIEFSFKEQERRMAPEKRAIAKAVAPLVKPGMAVTLDTGTTTLEVARAISGIKNLTVLTSSLAIASTLYPHDNIELVLLGGTVRRGNPDLSGWMTEDNLKQFKSDLAILGADGADSDGVYTTDPSIARVSQSMMAGARQRVLVVDHSKFAQSAFVKCADWSEVNRVVTDSGIASRDRQWLKRSVKELTVVDPERAE
ncbi:MAG: DeoR/GlpR transcriptional regulator [bacterium]|nr:DeoR/GlpR transcriptional regulator [bacterium]